MFIYVKNNIRFLSVPSYKIIQLNDSSSYLS